jgi:hypothetical protein
MHYLPSLLCSYQNQINVCPVPYLFTIGQVLIHYHTSYKTVCTHTANTFTGKREATVHTYCGKHSTMETLGAENEQIALRATLQAPAPPSSESKGGRKRRIGKR